MKGIFKRTLATIMVVLIVLTSVPLSGFVGLDWFDFTLSASAEDEEWEKPDNWVDYSDLTPNQYMAKVLLNYNYCGSANAYGERETTIAGEQMRWYTKSSNVSSASTLYKLLSEKSAFVNGVAAWKTLNFDPSESYEYLLDMEGYYEAILMSILDVQVKDDEFLDAWNCSANKTIMSISKSTLKNLEKFKDMDISQINLKQLDLSDFTDEEFEQLYSHLFSLRETKNLYKQAGDYLSDWKMYFSTCTTMYDVVSTVGKYAQLSDFSESVKNVLYSIYLNCPSSNTTMKSACKKVYESATEQLDNATITFIEAGQAFINNAFSYVIGKVWDYAKDAVLKALGSSLLVGMDLGRVVGKAITNFTFSTDAIIEQFFAIECLLQFESIITNVVSGFESAYKANETTENADNYMKSLEMLFSVYDLDYDYTYSFVQTAKDKGAYNTVKSWISGKDETLESYRSSISVMKSSMAQMKHTLTNLEGYRWYYEDDAPTAYDAYFNSHNSVSASYSKTEPVINIAPIFEVEKSNFVLLEYRIESDETATVIKCHPSSSGTVEIPKDFGGYAVRKIGNSAFCGCAGITEVIMPSTIRTIEPSAFTGCSDLSRVTLNEGLTGIGDSVFSGTAIESITIPSTVKTMSRFVSSYVCYSALMGAKNLKTVIFEEGIETIPSYALRACSVKEVIIPNSVTAISSWAFYDCAGLTEFIAPTNLKSIGEGAFQGCTGITNIVLNRGLQSLGNEVFSGTAIESIIIPSTVKTMSRFVSSYVCYSALMGAKNLKTVIFEEGIETIPSYALRACSVKEVIIPNSVTAISSWAFYDCAGLTEFIAPTNLKSIGEGAFQGCTNLKKVYAVKNTVGYKFAQENGLEIVEISCSHPSTELVVDSVKNCTVDGVCRNVCKVCSETVSTVTDKATGHNYSTEYVLIKATCKAEGLKKAICSNCGDVAEITIEKISHTYDNDKDATCNVCGDVREIEIHNHSYTSKITTHATCTTTGTRTYTCSCGDSYTETIKATGKHTGGTATCKAKAICTVCKQPYGELAKHNEVTVAGTPATYTSTGLTAGKKCSVCRKMTVAQKTIAKLSLGKVTGLKAKKVKVAKSSEIALTWNAVTGAKGYEIYQQNGSSWKKIKTTSGTSYTVKKLKSNKTYKFKVRAVVDGAEGAYSSTLKVETNPETTSKLTLKAGKKQLTASWKSVSDISGYEVQYSTSKKFTKKATKTVKAKKSSKKTTIKKLAKGKKYYVRVRTYKTVNGKKIYSGWSTVKNVKVK